MFFYYLFVFLFFFKARLGVAKEHLATRELLLSKRKGQLLKLSEVLDKANSEMAVLETKAESADESYRNSIGRLNLSAANWSVGDSVTAAWTGDAKG